MKTLLDLRYASIEHLTHDLKELALQPKQIQALLSCLRHYKGARLRLKQATSTKNSAVHIEVFTGDLILTSKVTAKGHFKPLFCSDWA